MKALKITQNGRTHVLSANILTFISQVQGDSIDIKGLSPTGDWWKLTKYGLKMETLSDMRAVVFLLKEYHRLYNVVIHGHGLTSYEAEQIRDWTDK